MLIIKASSNSLCLYYMSCCGAWLLCCSCWMWNSLSLDALQRQLYSKPGYQWQQGGPPLGEVAMAPVRQVCHLQEIRGLLGWKIAEKNIEEAAGLKSPVCSVFDSEIQESKQTHTHKKQRTVADAGELPFDCPFVQEKLTRKTMSLLKLI